MAVAVVIKTLCASILALLLIGHTALADQVITLPDGRSVNLKGDGTWAYIDVTISGILSLNFGKFLDQQGRCYAWPSLTNDTDKFIDGIVIEYSAHFNDGTIIKNGTLTYNILAVGKRSSMQEYLTGYDTATCNEVAYVQIDGINKCKIDGIRRDSKVCYDLLAVSAEHIQAIK